MTQRILLADDSVTIRRVVELTFSDEDFTIDSVGDGAEALAHARAERPDIIISDVVMPGLNGYDLCLAVKSDANLRTIPFLFLKGAFEGFDEQRAQACGADGFIVKPFESQEMVARVKEMIAAGVSAVPEALAPAPAPAPEPPTPVVPAYPAAAQPLEPAFAPPPPPPPQPMPVMPVMPPVMPAAAAAPPAPPTPPTPPPPVRRPMPPPVPPIVRPAPPRVPPPAARPAPPPPPRPERPIVPPPPAPPAPPPPQAMEEFGFDFGEAEAPATRGAASQPPPAPPVEHLPGETDEDLWSEVSLRDRAGDLLEAPTPFPPVESAEAPAPAAQPVAPAEAAFDEVPSFAPTAAPIPAAEPAVDQAALERLVAARVEAAVRQVLAPMVGDAARGVVEAIAWEVIPELAEAMIRTEIERIRQSTRTD